jgi:endonuclease/exonuclease/phosphatase family metal-dependent hydrolase
MILWSHNAYWFQGAPSLWGEERQIPHPEALDALTHLYRSLKPDVLLLQEVPNPDVTTALADALNMHSHYVPGGERPAYGGSILWGRDLHGAAKDLTTSTTPAGRRFERICMHLVLRLDDHELSLINLHLSSNRFAPDGQGEPVRLGEISTALGQVGSPAVMAGDFNAPSDSRVYDHMVQAGFREPHSDTGVRRIDYVWIDPGQVQAEALLTPDPFDMPDHTGTALSDHLPVGVRLSLTKQGH